jgi:peptide/nickel transport system permease protein
MTGFILKRLAVTLVLLVAVSMVTFVLTSLAPGDPARMAAGRMAPESKVIELRSELGLDKPLPVRYWRYVKRLAHLDLGVSYLTNRSVGADLARLAPPTLQLVFLAMLLTSILGVAFGTLSAHLAGSPYDRASTLVASATTAIPVFWAAIVLQVVFFYHLGWLPQGGQLPPGTAAPDWTGFLLLDVLLTNRLDLFVPALEHLILPVLALALVHIGVIARVTRQSLLHEMSRPYAMVAKAKGLSTWQITFTHTLRNALNPVISLIGIQFGYAIVGAVLVESIFDWPGLGQYSYEAISNLDYPAILGVTLFTAFAFAMVNLMVDIVQGILDPRTRVN